MASYQGEMFSYHVFSQYSELHYDERFALSESIIRTQITPNRILITGLLCHKVQKTQIQLLPMYRSFHCFRVIFYVGSKEVILMMDLNPK